MQSIIKNLCATAVLLGSAACTTSTATSAVGVVNAPEKVTDQTVTTSPGKPSAPVTVTFQSLGSLIAIGSPLSIKTVVTPTTDVDELQVRYSLSEGLMAVGTLPVLTLNTQKLGTPLSQTVVVSPLAEGQQYLNVFVSTLRAGQKMSKTVSFPIAVGNVSANKPAVSVQTSPDGERVISMPAVEPK